MWSASLLLPLLLRPPLLQAAGHPSCAACACGQAAAATVVALGAAGRLAARWPHAVRPASPAGRQINPHIVGGPVGMCNLDFRLLPNAAGQYSASMRRPTAAAQRQPNNSSSEAAGRLSNPLANQQPPQWQHPPTVSMRSPSLHSSSSTVFSRWMRSSVDRAMRWRKEGDGV